MFEPTVACKAEINGFQITYDGKDEEVLSQILDYEFEALKKHRREKPNMTMHCQSHWKGTSRYFLYFCQDDDPLGNYALWVTRLHPDFKRQPKEPLIVEGETFERWKGFEIHTYTAMRVGALTALLTGNDLHEFVKKTAMAFGGKL